MHRFLFTIGFTGKTAEEFFALLRQAEVETVIDVRQNRAGQLSAFAKHPDLAYFLKETAGIGYKHESLLAPTPELRKKYRSDKDCAAYEAGFFALMRQRGMPQSLNTTEWPARVALLCTEAGPEKCHRRLVAHLLAERWRTESDVKALAVAQSFLVAQAESKIPRGEVCVFATHQPNPRLVALLAKQCNVAPTSFPGVARTSGNLGAPTCGVALCTALQSASGKEPAMRKPIFMASLGPGLLFGGGWLRCRSKLVNCNKLLQGASAGVK